MSIKKLSKEDFTKFVETLIADGRVEAVQAKGDKFAFGLVVQVQCRLMVDTLLIPLVRTMMGLSQFTEVVLIMILEHYLKVPYSQMEMLVRAYDPCISCSTHMLDVKFVK